MALDEVSGATGSSRVTLKKLDDSTPLAGQWDPGKVSANARKAANDQSTVGYIGEFNSGASAISTPILNQSGVMEISPSNTYLGLTKRIRLGALGEPDKYYPPGKRTFARVAPADHIQAGALAEWMKELGVRRLYVVDDRNGCGEEVASVTAAAARLNGIKVVGRTGMDTRARSYRAIARRVRRSRADGFFFGGVTLSNAPRLYRDVWTADGDVTTSRFGRYLVKGGRLVYDRATIVKRDAYGNALT